MRCLGIVAAAVVWACGPATVAKNQEAVPEQSALVPVFENIPNRGGQRLYLRNTTHETYRVTTFTLSDCINVLGGCGKSQLDLTIPAGESRLIRVIEPLDQMMRFTYKWTYQAGPDK